MSPIEMVDQVGAQRLGRGAGAGVYVEYPFVTMAAAGLRRPNLAYFLIGHITTLRFLSRGRAILAHRLHGKQPLGFERDHVHCPQARRRACAVVTKRERGAATRLPSELNLPAPRGAASATPPPPHRLAARRGPSRCSAGSAQRSRHRNLQMVAGLLREEHTSSAR